MTRLQVLELPEGSGDERPPFVLVVDQYVAQRYIVGLDQPEPVDQFERIGERIGARAVLVFEETIEIPANEVPVDPDGYPLKIRVEGDFEQFRTQVHEEIHKAQSGLAHALRQA